MTDRLDELLKKQLQPKKEIDIAWDNAMATLDKLNDTLIKFNETVEQGNKKISQDLQDIKQSREYIAQSQQSNNLPRHSASVGLFGNLVIIFFTLIVLAILVFGGFALIVSILGLF